jgi:hypothetical protein
MCIRALDYIPPVDVTFFEYLRGIISADFDLVSNDRLHYRVAFVEAFRHRGIYPVDLSEPTPDTPRTLSVDTLRWQGLDQSQFPRKVRTKIKEQYAGVIEGLKRYAYACLYLSDRQKLFEVTRDQRRNLHDQLAIAFEAVPEFAKGLGLIAGKRFEVHELRRAMLMSPDGMHVPQIVVALTQSQVMKQKDTPPHVFRGGSTLLVDLSHYEVKYRIVKNINSVDRQVRTANFIREAATDPLRALFFSPDRREPFAALHSLADDGGF